MEEINKPRDPWLKAKCYKCGEILLVHEQMNVNSPWFTDCSMHLKDNEPKEMLGDLKWK